MANDRADNKIKTKLFFTALSLTVALVLLVGASYAWFTISTNPEVTGLLVNLYTKRTLLVSDEENPGEDNGFVEHIDLSGKLGYYNQLVPVSTYDGIHWYIPTYKLTASLENDGTLNNPNRFILDLTPTNQYANVALYSTPLTGQTLVGQSGLGSAFVRTGDALTPVLLEGEDMINAEKLGYYLYTDVWLKTEENVGTGAGESYVQVRMSIPYNQNGLAGAGERNDLEGFYGSYVMPKYGLDEDGQNLISLSNGSEAAFRVGYLVYGANGTTDFYIYEPNADLRSSAADIKGGSDLGNAESRYVIDESDSIKPADPNETDPDGHVWYLYVDPTSSTTKYKTNTYIETRPIKYLEQQTVEIPLGPLYNADGTPKMKTVIQYRTDPVTGQTILVEGPGIRHDSEGLGTAINGWSLDTVQLTGKNGQPLYYLSDIDDTIVDVETEWAVNVQTRTVDSVEEAREVRNGRVWIKKNLRTATQADGTQVTVNAYTLADTANLAWEFDYLYADDSTEWTGSETVMKDHLGNSLYYISATGGEYSTVETEWPVLLKTRTVGGEKQYRESRQVDGENRLWRDAPIQKTNADGVPLWKTGDGTLTPQHYSVSEGVIVENEPVYIQKRDSSGHLVFREEGWVPVPLTEKVRVLDTVYEPVLERVQVQDTGTSTIHSAEPAALDPSKLIIQHSSAWDTVSTDATLNANTIFEAGRTPTSSSISEFGRFYSASSIYENTDSFVPYVTEITDAHGNHTGNRTQKTRYYANAFADGNASLENAAENGDTGCVILTLRSNDPVKVRIFFWIEGQDADCWNDIASGELIVNIELAGYTVAAATD